MKRSHESVLCFLNKVKQLFLIGRVIENQIRSNGMCTCEAALSLLSSSPLFSQWHQVMGNDIFRKLCFCAALFSQLTVAQSMCVCFQPRRFLRVTSNFMSCKWTGLYRDASGLPNYVTIALFPAVTSFTDACVCVVVCRRLCRWKVTGSYFVRIAIPTLLPATQWSATAN